MMQPSGEADLQEELARQRDENRFLVGELDALRQTIRGLQASRDEIVSGRREPVYVPPKAATKGTTLNSATVRKWCASGEVDCERRGKGRWFVDLSGQRTQARLAQFKKPEKI